MTKEQADQQAKDLIQVIRDSGIKDIRVGPMNIIDVDKFLDVHESRMEFLETFSINWKTHYYRLYLLKKELYLKNK